MADVVDAEVVEGSMELAAYEPAPAPATLFGTDNPVEVLEKATEIADALKDVIDKKQLFTNIQGKQHVKVEGWQLLGSMLGVTAVCVHSEPVDGGWKATVQARTFDGRVVGQADALCTAQEKMWKNRDDYARLSMATTRATSKALKGVLGFVVSLAGYQTTPAEEMPVSEPVNHVHQSPVMMQQQQPIDFGNDPVLAEELKHVFRQHQYKIAKVRALMAAVSTDEERQQLLAYQTSLLPVKS